MRKKNKLFVDGIKKQLKQLSEDHQKREPTYIVFAYKQFAHCVADFIDEKDIEKLMATNQLILVDKIEFFEREFKKQAKGLRKPTYEYVVEFWDDCLSKYGSIPEKETEQWLKKLPPEIREEVEELFALIGERKPQNLDEVLVLYKEMKYNSLKVKKPYKKLLI